MNNPNVYTEGKWDFNKAFPVFSKVSKPICGRCEGRGVIPTAERKVVACPECRMEIKPFSQGTHDE